MSEDPPPGVLDSLPRTRPHRRSAKRGAIAAGSAPAPDQAPRPKSRSTGVKTDAGAAAKPRVSRAKSSAASKPGVTGVKSSAAASRARASSTVASRARAQDEAASRGREQGEAASPARPQGTPATPTSGRPHAPSRAASSDPNPRPGVVTTAVQAAAELTEIGLMASARALRGALSRLPRP